MTSISPFSEYSNANSVLLVVQDLFAGDQPSAITATDFTEDGFVDLAVALALDEEFVILANDGTGMFSLPESALVPLGLGVSSMLSGDFDGNKCPDLAGSGSDNAVGLVSGETQGRVFVLLGQGGCARKR